MDRVRRMDGVGRDGVNGKVGDIGEGYTVEMSDTVS